MIKDQYGQMIFTERDICNLYLINPDIKLKNILCKDIIHIPSELEIKNLPELLEYIPLEISTEEYDNIHSNIWFIPEEYVTFNIAEWILNQCKGEAELQRAGEELILYQEKDMFMMLRYLKYLVDTMRAHNIVWGVGRGSSVASFVLFLIGVHKINSLYYDLSITEFLK